LRIAVASGKGGTGKTTVAVNLYQHLMDQGKHTVALVDYDVEEPNAALFFPESKKLSISEVKQEIPVIDPTRCIYCRKCAEYCEFNAILVIPPIRFAEVNPSLCHSCGACMVACEYDAIWVKEDVVGTLVAYRTEKGGTLLEGRLKIGSSMQTMVIRSLKQRIGKENEIVILDAPPGTSCPVVETISDADWVVLVSEPTPFGLHDLRLMVDLVRELDKPFGVVINKAQLGDRKMYAFLETEKIPLLGEIPFSKAYASQYARGKLFHEVPSEVESAFEALMDQIEEGILLS
jgi:MinD superfamily P-loop ATPase